MTLATIKQQLAQKQFVQALQALQSFDETAADFDAIEHLYLTAVCQRYLQNFNESLASLRRLLELQPDLGRAYQEQGHCYRDQGQTELARAAYREALRHNPALHASWSNLARIEQQFGNSAQAQRDMEQSQYLLKQPRAVLAAMNLLYEGKLYKAEQLVREFLRQTPHHIEAMRTLANIGFKLNILADAEFLLESVLEFKPDYDLARYDYIKVLQQRQKFQQAHIAARELYQRRPENQAYKALYANQCVAVDDFDTALKLYDELLSEASSDHAGIYLAKGHLLKTAGETEQAMQAYQRAYQLRQDFGDAYWSLANLKTYRFSSAEIEQMRAALEQPVLQLQDKIHLLFALGKAYGDLGDAGQSFKFYQQGNELKQTSVSYREERFAADVARQKDFFTPTKVAELSSKKRSKVEDADPIFIVGLPRSGSTLVEQILASHSQVDGTMELPNILAYVRELNGQQLQSETPKYPAIIDELTVEQLSEFGQRYLDETRFHRQGAAFFTDKMPNNFRHVGFIKSILPNARIIDARRHPLDCCFSCFKQLFAEGQEFTYGLSTIAHYYRHYVDLMSHWKQLYPDSVYTLVHEDLIDAPEREISNLLSFLKLPIESQCFASHKTKRKVKTASSEQVRQPINRKGIGQWQAYEAYLDPLKDELGELLESWNQV